jgi:hypothetical protein
VRTGALILMIASILGGTAETARGFRAGIFSDSTDTTCVPAPGDFQQFAWVWTSGGTVYVTLRIDFPDNLGLRAAPVFDDRVIEFIRTDYPDGTEEWNMVLAGCPTGWVRLFQQDVTLRDDQPSQIVIRGADSWIRDCGFELHRIEVAGDLRLNDPACELVRARKQTFSILKHRYH